MTLWPTNHLTADDLDAFHSASPSRDATAHLAACETCRTMVLADRAVLAALAALPAFSPREGFVERVVAGTVQPAPAVAGVRRFATPAWRRRLALAAMLLVGVGTSVVWSLLNRDLLLSWIQLAAAETGRVLWLGLRMAASNVTEQPWYAPLREFASSPGRLVAAMSGSLLAYAAAITALRRLLTPPMRPVPHALG